MSPIFPGTDHVPSVSQAVFRASFGVLFPERVEIASHDTTVHASDAEQAGGDGDLAPATTVAVVGRVRVEIDLDQADARAAQKYVAAQGVVSGAAGVLGPARRPLSAIVR